MWPLTMSVSLAGRPDVGLEGQTFTDTKTNVRPVNGVNGRGREYHGEKRWGEETSQPPI